MTDRDDYTEFERLLPFYVNGTIKPSARVRLDAALATSPPLRAALEEERLIQAQVIAGVETELAASEAGAESRNASLHLWLETPPAPAATPASKAATPSSLLSALAFLSPRRWHPAVALSLAAALPLQGWLIAGKNDIIGELRDQNFQLASGPCEDRPLAGAVQLELADGAKWQDIAALLDAEGLSIAKNGDFGVLTVKSGKQGAALAALIARLKASALVTSSEPAA